MTTRDPLRPLRAPGSFLQRCAARVCSRTTLERLIDPIITDLQLEYSDARQRGDAWTARAILVRAYAAFWLAAGTHALTTCSTWMRDSIGGRRSAVSRAVWLEALTIAVFGAVFIVFTVLLMGQRDGALARIISAPAGRLMFALLFQGAWALPLGAMIAAASFPRDGHDQWRRRLTIVALVCGSTLLALLAITYIPEANQTLRVIVFGGDVQRGANELSFAELSRRLTDMNPATDAGRWALLNVRFLRLSYHARFAFVLAPLTYGWLGLALAGLGLASRAKKLLAFAITLSYVVYHTVPDFNAIVAGGRVMPEVVAWTPTAVSVLLAIALMVFARLRPAPPAASVNEVA